jgi:hypothetical protein
MCMSKVRLIGAFLVGLSVLGLGGVVTAEHAEAAVVGDRLNVGQTLAAGDELDSSGGGYRFVMQGDGNAVVYGPGAPQWGSSTSGGGNRLVLQTDGNAVIYTAQGRPVWNSGTGGRSVSSLLMQSDGNLVIYGADGRPTWSRTTGVVAPPPPPLTTVGSQLAAGRQLQGAQQLASGGSAAIMQTDGNLVVYVNGRPQWQSGTGGHPGAFLALQTDGNAVIYTAQGRPVWNSGTGGRSVSSLVMQSDGNLVIYGADGLPTWSRTTGVVALPQDKGWVLQSYQISKNVFDWFDGTARITNTNPTTMTGGWTLTIFATDGRMLGTLEGSQSSVAPGQTVTVDFFSVDDHYAGPYGVTFQTDYSYDF